MLMTVTKLRNQSHNHIACMQLTHILSSTQTQCGLHRIHSLIWDSKFRNVAHKHWTLTEYLAGHKQRWYLSQTTLAMIGRMVRHPVQRDPSFSGRSIKVPDCYLPSFGSRYHTILHLSALGSITLDDLPVLAFLRHDIMAEPFISFVPCGVFQFWYTTHVFDQETILIHLF